MENLFKSKHYVVEGAVRGGWAALIAACIWAVLVYAGGFNPHGWTFPVASLIMIWILTIPFILKYRWWGMLSTWVGFTISGWVFLSTLNNLLQIF